MDWNGLGSIGLEFFLELWIVLVPQNGELRKLPEFCLVSCGIQELSPHYLQTGTGE